MKNKLTQLTANKPFLLVLAFGLVAATIIAVSLAASPNASLEPESSSNRENVAVRSDANASNGQYVQFSGVEDNHNNPVELSWEEAWETRDQSVIDEWYTQNTGYDALGLSSSELLDIGDEIIDDDWLDDNEGNGHVRQEAGRWVVEGIKAGRIRVGASNVTVRGCGVERSGGGQSYGVAPYPTWGSSINDVVVEYCTFSGAGNEGKAAIVDTSAGGVNGFTLRYSDLSGYKTGIEIGGNATVEYNWAHDLHFFEGSHNASGANRGAHVIMRRNHFEDGNSSALSIYADKEVIHNMLVEENLFNTPRAHYCINFASSKEYFSQTYDSHLINNIFGQKYNPTCGRGAPMAGGNWTTRSGNTFMDGAPAFN